MLNKGLHSPLVMSSEYLALSTLSPLGGKAAVWRKGGFSPKNQTAYGKKLTSMKSKLNQNTLVSETSEASQGDTSPCRETTQKPAHKLFPYGKNHSDAFLSLPLGGAGGGSALIHNGVSIKPCEGPAAANCLTIKKHTFTLAEYDALPNQKVQTIINRSLLFGSPLVGKPEGKGVINFYKMKKQILFLAMITLAFIFAGTSKSYGQTADASSTPIPPLACADTSSAGFVPLPLHPFPGVPYTYRLDGTGTAGNPAETYTWWATKDPNFVTAEGTFNDGTALASPAVSNTSSTYGTSTTLTSDPNADRVTITWSADILASTEYQGDVTAAGTPAAPSPTFVVGYAVGDSCSDNIQVWEIDPLPNFVIDIAPIDPADNATTLSWDATANNAETCVDQVQTATYNNSTKEIDIDYGTNVFYFEVAAANFVANWNPSFYINSGLNTTQEVVLSMFETLADATGNTGALATSASLTTADMSTTPGTFSWAPGVQITAADPADVASGVSVYIRVEISNNTEESLADNPFVLAVDAIDDSGSGIWDMEDDDCSTVTDAEDMVDNATITVTPRPSLDQDDTLMNEPNSDTPDDVIIKTN